MHATKVISVFLFLATSRASADSTSCLEHTGGGGRHDYECYASLAAEVGKKVAALSARANNLSANRYRKEINSCFLGKNEEKYCQLRRMALYDWVEDKSNNIKYQDVEYAICLYEEKLELVKKLEKLIEGSGTKKP